MALKRVIRSVLFGLTMIAASGLLGANAITAGPGRESDLQVVARCDTGLADVMRFVREKPELFQTERTGLFTIEEKREIWNTWKRFLEYELALEAVAQLHSKYYELDGAAERQSFYAGYAASLTQYRYALEFLELTSSNEVLDKLLDESVPDIGLESDGYSKFKFQFLNTGRGLEFGAREIVYASYARKNPAPNHEVLRRHAKRIWEMGRGRGQKMTLANASKIVRRVGFDAWLPIQTGVSEFMGDTKVYRAKESLISPDQISRLRLEPGDIML